MYFFLVYSEEILNPLIHIALRHSGIIIGTLSLILLFPIYLSIAVENFSAYVVLVVVADCIDHIINISYILISNLSFHSYFSRYETFHITNHIIISLSRCGLNSGVNIIFSIILAKKTQSMQIGRAHV